MADANVARRGASGSAAAEHARSRLAREKRRAAEDARDLYAALCATGDEWSAALRSNMRRSPYTALAVAAGVGYVLAGGLAPSVVRLAVGTGWRFVAASLLRQLMASGEPAARRP